MSSGGIERLIKEAAAGLGFHRTVIASLAPLDEEREHFERWLKDGYSAGMTWLKRNPHFRTSPQLLLPQVQLEPFAWLVPALSRQAPLVTGWFWATPPSWTKEPDGRPQAESSRSSTDE